MISHGGCHINFNIVLENNNRNQHPLVKKGSMNFFFLFGEMTSYSGFQECFYLK